jgi:hypothetical protein
VVLRPITFNALRSQPSPERKPFEVYVSIIVKKSASVRSVAIDQGFQQTFVSASETFEQLMNRALEPFEEHAISLQLRNQSANVTHNYKQSGAHERITADTSHDALHSSHHL